jgi:hypothetical protein
MNRKLENFMGILIGILTLGYYHRNEVRRHQYTVRSHFVEPVKITYKQFKKQAISKDWTYIPQLPGGLFTEMKGAKNDMFYDGILHFKGVGCLLTSYGLLRANRWRRKKYRALWLESKQKANPKKKKPIPTVPLIDRLGITAFGAIICLAIMEMVFWGEYERAIYLVISIPMLAIHSIRVGSM